MRLPRVAPVAVLGVLCASAVSAQALPHVLIRTTMGDIEIEVDSVHAPVTAANFLRYVDLQFYSNFGRFHRAVRADNQAASPIKIAVIQAGLEPYRAQGFPPIPLERTNATGLHHLDGTISMARDGPGAATSDFFICIGDQPALDFGGKRNPDGQGFAAFGRVVRGMAIVNKIHDAPAKDQTLTPVVKFLGVARVPARQS
ncbi:MAG: peptidylprolyl isomerase [Gemmatimonadales bacterium]